MIPLLRSQPLVVDCYKHIMNFLLYICAQLSQTQKTCENIGFESDCSKQGLVTYHCYNFGQSAYSL